MGLLRNGENVGSDEGGLVGFGVSLSKSFADPELSIGHHMFDIGGDIQFSPLEHGGDHINSVASYEVAEFQNSS